MENQYDITIYDGKYRVIMDDNNRLYALRYGEPWRDLCGDNLILALVQEIANLKQDLIDAELIIKGHNVRD